MEAERLATVRMKELRIATAKEERERAMRSEEHDQRQDVNPYA